jgi:bifunctional DNA-binding transcriptional regulator/antitoxin component of YhaV-PrlF toxin-antitoxin module
MLQKQNRLQVPKLVRWEYKLEPSEVLKVTVTIVGKLGFRESFIGKMLKDGRLVIPKLTMALLNRDEPSLEGHVMEVTLEPT